MRASSRNLAVFLLWAACFSCFSSGCRRAQPRSGPAFDVPRLLGKDITEIRSLLGPSVPAPPGLPPLSNANHAYKSWNTGGQSLTVEYSKSSGLVVGFTLSVDEQSGSLKNREKESFLKTGNLTEVDPRYSVTFVEASDQVFYFTGVKVIPQQNMHKVVFRVTGTSSLLQVSYAVGPGSAPQTLMTIPPWEYSTEAAIDTPLSLEAVPLRTNGVSPAPNLQMTVQILVDDKVLCENASSGPAATCASQL